MERERDMRVCTIMNLPLMLRVFISAGAAIMTVNGSDPPMRRDGYRERRPADS